ncbi:MAG: ABC transporter permease, partial [Gemmatimonadales bacterium]
MDTLLRDIRYAVRSLLKTPGFTIVAVVTLALGIGANTAIFSVVDAVLLRPLTYPASERLVALDRFSRRTGGDLEQQLSFPDFRDIRSQSRAFRSVAAFRYYLFNVTGDDAPESVLGIYTGDSLFSTLQVQFARGRAFAPGADQRGAPAEVILSDGFWRRHYDADPSVLGSSITVDGAPRTVVGILPGSFAFPDVVPAEAPLPSRAPDVYLPLGAEADGHDARGSHNYWAIARLNAGATLAAAQNDLATIAGRLRLDYPGQDADLGLGAAALRDAVVGTAGRPLTILLGAVVLVLLIACANVGGLLTARGAARHRELSIRTALGASRKRLGRQLLTESLVLAVLGGGLGVLLAAWGIQVLRNVAPNDVPRLGEVVLNGRILLFTAGLSVVSGVLFGLSPIVGLDGTGTEGLRETGRASGGRERRRMRSGLVVAEVALSIALLVGAGLLLRSFIDLAAVDPGFDGTNVVTMLALLPHATYPDEASFKDYEHRALARIAEVPGVTDVGAVNTLPLSNLGNSTSLRIVGQPAPPPGQEPVVAYRVIGGSYFHALDIAVVAGRAFGPGDTAGARPVALINQAAAARFFPGQDPIGHQLTLDNSDSPPRTIVGIVHDVHGLGLDRPAEAEVSYPYEQGADPILTFVVRTRSDPHADVPAIRRALAQVDPQLGFFAIRTMPELLASTLARRRFDLLLLAGFAATALLLAAVGLYGLIAYSVAQRTREIGIRMALGADAPLVQRLVIREGLELAVAGMATGLLLAAVLTRFLQSQLFGVGALDPIAYAAVVALFT